MPRRALLAALLATALLPAVRADKPARDVTVEDYFSLATVTDLALSPDAKHVAYCEARWQKDTDDRKADLWVVRAPGKQAPRRLTGDRANERQLRWRAVNSVLVLANRKRAGETKPPYDGTSQVWQVFLDGRDPRPVTRVEGGVAGYDYAPAADAIFYAADAKADDDDGFSKLRSTFAKLEYGHGKRKVSEVYRLDLHTWRAEKVVAEKRYVRELAVSRDGKRLAMITAPDDTVITSEGRARVDFWDAGSGKVTGTDETWRKTAASLYPWLESLAWSPDGNRLAYVTVFDAYPAEVIVNTFKEGKPVAQRMKRSGDLQVEGYGSPLRWADERELLFLAEHHGRVALARYDADANTTGSTTFESSVVSAFDATGPKSIVQLRGTPDELPEVIGTDGRPLTSLNPQAKAWKRPSVGHITWKAPDGATVGGVLEMPAGAEKGTRLPLVVAIHGGPTTSVKANLEFSPYEGRMLFAAKGYALLCPNYRGSTGYGDKFVTDLIGNENDVDVKDILAGIQHLIKEGVADPDRIAVMGWSNGGYLTNCLITLKDPPVKIRAASSGAGILDTVAEWGFNDEPAYPMVFKKGLPWETPDVYRKTSPTYGLGHVTTPTLIHVGGNDERCPPGHSRMLYRALREYVKVPTQLVVYPGEPHGLTKYTNRKAKMEWDLAWFERYVMNKGDRTSAGRQSPQRKQGIKDSSLTLRARKGTPVYAAEGAILELELPRSADPPSWAPERVSKLEIDGKDYSTPREEKRTVKVEPKKGSDSVTVTYTFWINTYTRIIRTKVVKVENGKTAKVSLLKPDADQPDKIYVIYVPTPQPVVEAMCKLGNIGKDDVVYDIGCGDGRLVITAVKKFGAKKAVGIDISEERIKECRANAKKAGVEDKVTFLHKDALTIKDFSEASVVLMYLTDPLCEALRPTLQKTLKDGSRIVSHRFRMGEWKPDKTEKIRAKDNDGEEDDFELHLWTIKKP
jgi:dipeptidyl aminopeptidase/acylaminoacyl peptidase